MYLSTTEYHGAYWMLLKLLKDAQEVQTSEIKSIEQLNLIEKQRNIFNLVF